jgi:hypothetical protein
MQFAERLPFLGRGISAMQALRLCCLVLVGFVVEGTVCEEGRTVITVRSASGFGNCPSCGAASRRIHSRYRRRVADLPLSGRSVQLLWWHAASAAMPCCVVDRYSPSGLRTVFWRHQRGEQAAPRGCPHQQLRDPGASGEQ